MLINNFYGYIISCFEKIYTTLLIKKENRKIKNDKVKLKSPVRVGVNFYFLIVVFSFSFLLFKSLFRIFTSAMVYLPYKGITK